jgi:hypothetical protein
MRKLSALFILIVVFFPLAFAAMTLTAIRPWILDRSFYERLLSDERLYEVPWTDDLSSRFAEEVFTPVEQLPLEALSIALREVVTPDYLRTQSLNVVNEVFDYLEGRERNFELSLDITPVKAALAGQGGMRFATALAAALPTCATGQQPIAPGGRLTRCIAAEGSVNAAAKQIAAALPAVLEDTPDQIILNGQGYIRMNWYDYAWFLGSSVHAVLDLAILMMIFTAAGAAVVGAFLGGDDLRGRLKWLSASLFAPGSLFLFTGLILTSPLIVGPISSSLASARWGAQNSESYREAVADVIIPVVQQLGSGFLLTGVVACLIALVLLFWSLATPARGQQNPKMVQVQVRNP